MVEWKGWRLSGGPISQVSAPLPRPFRVLTSSVAQHPDANPLPPPTTSSPSAPPATPHTGTAVTGVQSRSRPGTLLERVTGASTPLSPETPRTAKRRKQSLSPTAARPVSSRFLRLPHPHPHPPNGVWDASGPGHPMRHPPRRGRDRRVALPALSPPHPSPYRPLPAVLTCWLPSGFFPRVDRVVHPALPTGRDLGRAIPTDSLSW